MKDTGRSYLDGSILLSRNRDGSSPEEYFAKSVIGEGSSSVCYEARRKRRDGIVETGKLKEFYPADAVMGGRLYYSMERLSNGQLVPGSGTIRKFDDMCEDYLDTYKLLREVMVNHPENEILKSYIQHGEILYGCMSREKSVPGKENSELSENGTAEVPNREDDRRPTVYIWSPGVPGKGFDVYLKEVRRNPTKKPEKRLWDILEVMDALTDCVKALHTAGLLHMDIKPSNFLVQYDSNFKIKPDRISLFDINTLCSIRSPYLRASGTKGFCAPEVARGKADNRSDIYSIGAMLFYAVVITKDIPNGFYRDDFYPNIDQLVRHSKLFRKSEVCLDTTLMSRICRILKKCLARSVRARYQSCSELIRDIKLAKNRLNKILRSPTEKVKKGISDPTIVIQKLLYQHPLYETVPEGVGDLNVLVIGSGTYGQKFIDICLQAGQMVGCALHITAVSDEPEENQESYLRFRPALSEWIRINGSMKGTEQTAYASLDFRGISHFLNEMEEEAHFTEKPSQINQEIVKNLIGDAAAQRREYHYIFVALGEDAINQSIASHCSQQVLEQWGHACPVCYVCQRSRRGRKTDPANKLIPVWINEPLDVAAIDQRFGEMAFNTHISWKNTMNLDVTKERKKFFTDTAWKSKYNRTSSLAFVLSIKYKLHSVHIEWSDPQQAAELFSEQILKRRSFDDRAKKQFDQLVDLEHRRWLMEKAIDGWIAPRDENGNLKLEDCVTRGSVIDRVNQLHPCMVRGSERSPLSSSQYTENHHAKWDEGEIDPNLDELDRMSVALHRCFKRHADHFRGENAIQDLDLARIQDLIPENHTEAVRAFKQFQFALKNMLNGVESYCRQYDYYHDALEDSLSGLPKGIKNKILERLAVIKHAFFPVVESHLYRNYKANDEVLIERIPFILTYRYAPAIAMAFQEGKYQNGRNEAVFANAASATVLSPERIDFLYCCDSDSSVELLIRKMDALLNYFGKRKVPCRVKLIIACLNEVPDQKLDRLQKELRNLQKRRSQAKGNAWYEDEVFFYVGDHREAMAKFIQYLTDNPVDLYDGGNQLFPSVFDNAMFVSQVVGQNIPYFEFDWKNKRFTTCAGCEYLKYVKNYSFIRIQDMFALMNAVDNRFHLPEFADDYETLWKIYTGEHLTSGNFASGVASWNRLCRNLGEYERNRTPLAKIIVDQNRDPVVCETLTYFLPAYTCSTVRDILRRLVEFGVAEEDSFCVNYTSDTCKLCLKINPVYQQEINEIFKNPKILLPYYGISVRRIETDECVLITYDDLTVTNVPLNRDEYFEDDFYVLKQLENVRFIRQLRQNENDPSLVSFVYSSPRIKRLLTSAGEILEVYAYYEVLKTGYFDDAACGYEFSWESGGVKNELDLVLTKGFKSMIVKCKADAALEADDYHKLYSIADHFGIGTVKVMLGNPYTHADAAVDHANETQKSRGHQLNIQTISDEAEIVNIGGTLAERMENSSPL